MSRHAAPAARAASTDAAASARPAAATPRSGGAPAGVPQYLQAGGGQALDGATRRTMEARFGHDFGPVRIHDGGQADAAARAIGARAYTQGRDVVFAAGRYAPHTPAGRRLIAHELTHVVQQSRPLTSADGDAAEQEADALSDIAWRPGGAPLCVAAPAPAGRVQCDAAPGAAAAATPPTVGSAQDGLDFLQEMERFVPALRSAAQERLRNIFPIPIHTAYAEHYRVHEMLSQQRLGQMLAVARSTYEFQVGRLAAGDAMRERLRSVYMRVLHELRLAMREALAISNGLSESRVAQPERLRYAQNLAAWIDASPITSAGLADSGSFSAADSAAAAAHETELQAYLDQLIATLPGLTLTDAERNQIFDRLQAALRRAFVTLGTGAGAGLGAAGTIDVRAITNPAIVERYRRVLGLVGTGAAGVHMDLITSTMPAYTLPDPVPDVSNQFASRTVDLSHVPASELAAVRFGVLQAVGTTFSSGLSLTNAYWPVVLLTRRGGAAVPVRYELVFDASGNVRAERLGAAALREVAPAFQSLTLAQKKAQLIADFGLAAVDDRPPATGRTAARWTGPELDQVKAAFELLPAADRAALAGVTLVRDHHGPAAAAGSVETGFFHTVADPAHDTPGPAAHGTPHIHYNDDAFASNSILSVGPSGATGPGGDWTLLHEVGHGRMAIAGRAANTAISAANTLRTQRNTQLNAATARLRVSAAQQTAWTTWGTAQLAANAAIVAFNGDLTSAPPASAATQSADLASAGTAVTARNTARAALATAGLPAAVTTAAANLDAANDAMLAASTMLAAAQDQVPIFVSLAGTFGFHRFTEYSRTGADNGEWFAETYALHLSDPNRLLQMNRSMFLWFEAGMPMSRTWRPPAP